MQAPVGVVGGAAEDLHRPGARVGRRHDDLQRHAALLRQHQAFADRQVLQTHIVAAADLARGGLHQFKETGGREQREIEDAVIGQPRLRVEADRGLEDRQRARQRAAEQRVPGARLAEGRAHRAALRRHVELLPVMLALERIRRQRRARPLSVLHRGPVRPHAAHEQLAEAVEHRQRIVASLAQRRDPRAVRHRAAALRHVQQRRLRADLDEDAQAVGLQRGDRLAEAHRVAHMAAPVAGPADLVAGQPAADVRCEQQPRRMERDLRRHRLEGIEHRLHRRRVEGMRDLQQLRLDAGDRQPLQRRVDRVGAARDHGVLRAVRRGDGQHRRIARDRGAHGGLVAEHRGHRAIARQRAHQPAAFDDQLQAVGEA